MRKSPLFNLAEEEQLERLEKLVELRYLYPRSSGRWFSSADRDPIIYAAETPGSDRKSARRRIGNIGGAKDGRERQINAALIVEAVNSLELLLKIAKAYRDRA
jgi:hypothetical protein